MKFYSFIIPAALTFALFSCNSVTESSISNSETIDIENSIGKAEVVKLSEVAKSIEYIPLETNDSVLLSEISSLVFSNDRIYVSDNSKIFVFDNKGNHIRTLNRKGRGPGEYLTLQSFKVDKITGSIFISDQLGKVTIYDSLHNYVSSVEPKVKSMFFTGFENFGDTLFFATFFSRTLESEMIMFNNQSKLIDSGLFKTPSYKTDNDNKSRVIIPPIIFRHNNEIRCFARRGADTVFSINNKLEKTVAYVFKLGKYIEPADATNQEVGSNDARFISINNLTESDNTLFLSVKMRGLSTEPIKTSTKLNDGSLFETINTNSYAIYNKRDGKFTILAQPIKGKMGFEDDIKGAMPFWPRAIGSAGELILFKKAADIIKYVSEEAKAGAYIKDLASKLNENSNPVVAIARMK
ncbi:MAG: 6-bladed beta-propeller [Bacteroidales bacterium]